MCVGLSLEFESIANLGIVCTGNFIDILACREAFVQKAYEGCILQNGFAKNRRLGSSGV